MASGSEYLLKEINERVTVADEQMRRFSYFFIKSDLQVLLTKNTKISSNLYSKMAQCAVTGKYYL